MFPLPDSTTAANIKAVGVGGGGTNAIDRMARSGARGIEFIALNTDAQALARVAAHQKIHLGNRLTRGLGAGGRPEVGTRAAEETSDQIYAALKGADMVFVTAGLGGGTGTGAAPVVAQIAREVSALTILVVTTPFGFEGARRRANAEKGLAQLADRADTLIVVPNDRLLGIVDPTTSVDAAFKIVDEVLQGGIQSIAELIVTPGLINLDFADVRTIMAHGGPTLMASGQARGARRAEEAARAAIANPILDVSIDGAKGILLNVTGGPDLTLFEVSEAADVVTRAADPEANVIFGAVIDPTLEGMVKITVVATGIGVARTVNPFSTPNLVESRPDAMPRTPVVAPRFDGVNLEIPAFLRRRSEP